MCCSRVHSQKKLKLCGLSTDTNCGPFHFLSLRIGFLFFPSKISDKQNILRDRGLRHYIMHLKDRIDKNKSGKGSGALLVRLYKDAGAPAIECSPSKF